MTIDYYNEHAKTFIADTQCVEMGSLYQNFLAHVAEGGRIVDAGCGSGRDSRFFASKGYDVLAFDASQEMVKAASVYTGLPVRLDTFKSFHDEESCDAVWACASLLHVPRNELAPCLENLTLSMKTGSCHVCFIQIWSY